MQDTQKEAIEHAKQLNPNDYPDVERVRSTSGGKPEGYDQFLSSTNAEFPT